MKADRAVLTTVALVAVIGVGGCGGGGAATASGGATTTDAPATTTTTMATTTTLSDAQRISQMISAEGGEVFTYGSASNDYLHNMAIPLAVTNTSMAPISAFQVVFTISVTDQLGRTNSIRKRLDCTRALAPGESFAGEIPEGAPHDIGRASLSELDAAIAIEDQNNDGSCRVGIYEINSFKTDEMAVWDAVQSGVPATITTAVTRVSFPDGTGIGTALG